MPHCLVNPATLANGLYQRLLVVKRMRVKVRGRVKGESLVESREEDKGEVIKVEMAAGRCDVSRDNICGLGCGGGMIEQYEEMHDAGDEAGEKDKSQDGPQSIVSTSKDGEGR